MKCILQLRDMTNTFGVLVQPRDCRKKTSCLEKHLRSGVSRSHSLVFLSSLVHGGVTCVVTRKNIRAKIYVAGLYL